jgi:hypothetical protein
VILSFLKRERERFPLFVPLHYCVPARTLVSVPDRSALKLFAVPDQLHERSASSLNRVCGLFETRNGQECLGTIRDVGRSESFIMSKISDLKRLQNHVHVHVSKSKENCSYSIELFNH